MRRTLAEKPELSYGIPKDLKKLRVPSYCDRVLCHSLPHLQNNLQIRRTWPVTGVTTSDHKPICSLLTLTPSPLPPPRTLTPVTLAFRNLMLIGEPGNSPLVQKSKRAKVRFFASPPGILVAPFQIKRHSSGFVERILLEKDKSRRRSGSRVSTYANLRTKPAMLESAVVDDSGREVLTWDDADVPPMLLACAAEDLHKVTLIVSLYCYSKNSALADSQLRGTVQLRLSPPDAAGRIALKAACDILPSACTMPISRPADAAAAPSFAQGPFRMMHCTSAQPFALAFEMHAEVANAGAKKSNLGGRASQIPLAVAHQINQLLRGARGAAPEKKPTLIHQPVSTPSVRIHDSEGDTLQSAQVTEKPKMDRARST